MTDIACSLTATHREVGSRRIAAGEARTALMRRRYDAPVEDVWDACTDPDRISRWFIKPTGDLRPGGTQVLFAKLAHEPLPHLGPSPLRAPDELGALLAEIAPERVQS
jgi:Activator of Hsp90 ATPase homolog 1-like protein